MSEFLKTPLSKQEIRERITEIKTPIKECQSHEDGEEKCFNIDQPSTFPFPIDKERIEALKMIKSGEIDEEKVLRLLESEDFVKQHAGVYLLNKISEFSKENSEKFLLILEKLIYSEEPIIREGAIRAKIKIIIETQDTEKTLLFLEELIQYGNYTDRKAIIDILGQLNIKISENFLPILEKLIWDKDSGIKEAAIKVKITKTQDTEKTLLFLEELIQQGTYMTEKTIANILGQIDKNISEKFLPILEKLIYNEEPIIRKRAIRAKIKIIIETQDTEKTLLFLEELIQHGNYEAKEAMLNVLILNQLDENISENFLLILEKLIYNKDLEIKGAAIQVLKALNRLKSSNKFYSRLLAFKKPLFATIELEQLVEKIISLEKITKEMKEKFKDDFVGIVVFGSTTKGYSIKESDIDCGIIAKNNKKKEIFDYFKELSNKYNLKLCDISGYCVWISDNDYIFSNQEILFKGLFFGDQEKLLVLQETILKNIDKTRWDIIRKKIKKEETKRWKAAERYNLTLNQLEELEQIILLQRVPLSYEETLKLVQQRV
ncbi:MAG: nucleotidyltransferase domain-containing protein [Candidatus Kuenenbacteria bacterium]